MRNRALHDALRDFALEAAALLSDDLHAGAEIEFDVSDEHRGRGPALYRYRPRTSEFIAARWERLRALPSCARASDELGTGASGWLQVVEGLKGKRAEPALQGLLDRLYEDATSFGFPEERFTRVYREVEQRLYRDTFRATVVAPLLGAQLGCERVDLGAGLSLVRGERADAPREAAWPDESSSDPAVLCVYEREARPGNPLRAREASERFGDLVSAMRLFRGGRLGLAGVGWRRAESSRWGALIIEGSGPGRGEEWTLEPGEEHELREFLSLVGQRRSHGHIGWALSRFEMGCERASEREALTDYLLALKVLLDATGDAGESGLALRVAALCAEEGQRRPLQRRIELAQSLEHFVMCARPGGPEVPDGLVDEVEGHLRALLRDVLCGYLDPDLRSVADDMLLEVGADPLGYIKARDLRAERADAGADPDQEAAAEPAGAQGDFERYAEEQPELAEESQRELDEDSQHEPREDVQPDHGEQDTAELELHGVTASADWGTSDPDDYSAPV
ncbi:MAG TPA: hypothetical protein VEQ61_03630 [Thermoleophilaceae bacterium]|nr:hypothetical protein [Thermoleophilaceae bacterium]